MSTAVPECRAAKGEAGGGGGGIMLRTCSLPFIDRLRSGAGSHVLYLFRANVSSVTMQSAAHGTTRRLVDAEAPDAIQASRLAPSAEAPSGGTWLRVTDP